MTLKKYFLPMVALAVFSTESFAQMTENQPDCDDETQDCTSVGSIRQPNKSIYPYKPYDTSYIKERVQALYEGKNYLANIFEMEKRGLNVTNTTVQPWGGPYWPLFQGQIGNNYQDKDYSTYIFSGLKSINWKANVRAYKKRKEKIHTKIYDLSEEDLAKLAPSEKYDLILGDTSFDLTNRIWNYAEKWGNEKKWGFLSAIEIPEGYRIPEANKLMAFWEGICHGWAVAAGHSPRPERTVFVTLPNGKRLPFYPNDIKALISLMWANSTIQSNVIFEGNRCNKKNPDKDEFGRYIDIDKDRNDTSLLPRCADVHPAIFHVAMVNILGIEGRSFVVDHKPNAPIANQPVSGYELKYFNPMTGKEGPLSTSVISRIDYGTKDLFAVSRNPEATHIVGVQTKVKYTDWEQPRKKEINSSSDDVIKGFEFEYDLELNAAGEIIGGQWRVTKKGGRTVFNGSTNQPDFFWVVPRDWKSYFKASTRLPEWNLASGNLPPKEFLPAAKGAHSFVYEESKRFFATSPKCPVFPIKGGAPIQVDCEFRYPRPQPLINVVDKLLEESRK